MKKKKRTPEKKMSTTDFSILDLDISMKNEEPVKCGEIIFQQNTFLYFCTNCSDQIFEDIASFTAHFYICSMESAAQDEADRFEEIVKEVLLSCEEDLQQEPLLPPFTPPTQPLPLQQLQEQSFHQPFNEVKLNNSIIEVQTQMPLYDEMMVNSDEDNNKLFPDLDDTGCGRDSLYLSDSEYTPKAKKSKRKMMKPRKSKIVYKDSYKCEICDKVFDKRASFLGHRRDHKKNFLCPKCGKSFSQSNHLSIHLRTHSGEKPYQCLICETRFRDKTALACHQRVHTREKPFECQHCGKAFTTNWGRKFHTRQHTKEVQYKCEICEKVYVNQYAYQIHMKTHSGKRDFECDICKQKFFTVWVLKAHMAVHGVDKFFECEYCGSKFPRKRTLLEHQKLHADKKQYKCEECGKDFAQYSGLCSHRKFHHKKNEN